MDAESTDRPLYTSPDGERKNLQHLPAPVVGRAWEIYRFELLYFDPEFQRWQLFQDDQERGGQEGKRDHRTHIQSLLASLSAAFDRVPVGTPVRVVRGGNQSERDIEVPVTKEKWNWLWQDTSTEQIASVWHKFITELRESADRDGLLEKQAPVPAASPATKPVERTWRGVLDELEKWAEILSEHDVSLKLMASDARNLLSLLPILRHWDLFGAIRHGWQQPTEAPPPSLWQKIGQLREPGYCTHFVIRDKTNEGSSASRDIVGYEIAVEAVFTDLANRDQLPTWISLQEYFDYAYSPKDIEKTFYRLYSLFMDSIQVGLSSKEALVLSDAKPSDDQHLYYFAYPVFSTLGRRHFLHAYVRPPQHANTAVDLWSAWQQFHKHLDWEDLRHVLVDELEQTDSARFQRHVMDRIEEISRTKCFEGKNVNDMNESYCVSLVADQMHLLFPIECACDGKSLGFQTQRPEIVIGGSPWSQLKLVGSVTAGDLGCLDCKGNIASPHDNCKRSQPNGSTAVVVWNEHAFLNPTPVQKVIAEGRRERLIAQQLDFCRLMWKSHSGTRQVTFKHNEEDWKKKREPILARNREALLIALGTVDSSYTDRFARSEVTALLEGEDCNSFFKSFFYLTFIDPINGKYEENAWQQVYRKIVGGSLHATLSEYIETGVVQLLLHADEPRMRVDKVSLLQAYEPVHNRLVGSIPNDAYFQSTRDAVARINGCVLAVINACNDEPFPVGDIVGQCAPITSCRKDFFSYDIEDEDPETSDQKLRRYLALEAGDVVSKPLDNMKMRINLSSPAFGLGTVWSENILAELRSKSFTKKLYAIGCQRRLEKVVTSVYHRPAQAYQVCLLIGLPLSESEWQPLAIQGNSKPGVWDVWGNHVGNWGHTFLIKARSDRTRQTFSLPDVTEYHSLPLEVERCVEALLPLDNQQYWTFLGLGIEGYKVV